MGYKRSLLIASIIGIALLSFAFRFIVTSNPIKEDNRDNGTKPSISLFDTTEPGTTEPGTTEPGTTELEIKSPDTTSKSYEGHTYESYLSFPYDNMRFVDDDGFEIIKEAYDNVDFNGEFKKGDLGVYDFHKEKYNRLLKNEITFTDPKTGKELYLDEFNPIKFYSDTEVYDVNDYMYNFFDMDEDGAPELCITNDFSNFTFIFKYVTDLDKIILWYEMDGGYHQLNGSKKVRYANDTTISTRGFSELDKNAEEEYYLYFYSREDYNKRINQSEVVYMVSLPRYTNEDIQIEITDEIKNQAYFDEGRELYYFRVTEQQYTELTNDYFKAEELAKENIKEVTFTYDELFGTY